MAHKLIFMDFETRSKLDIFCVGAPKYASHASTVPLMLSYGNDSGYAQWVLDLSRPSAIPTCPSNLRALIEDTTRVEFHAHNAGFEIAIWELICINRWGWPTIDRHRWHCTAARAAATNQPRSLDRLGVRLNLAVNQKKESRGKDLIKMLSCPTKCLKTYLRLAKDSDGNNVPEEHTTARGLIRTRNKRVVNKSSTQYLTEQGTEVFELTNQKGKTYSYFFNEDADLMREFCEYNKQDIIAEIEVHKRLPPAHDRERPLWLIDLDVNRRGIPVDLELCRGALAVYEVEVAQAHGQVEVITSGAVTKTTQVKRLVEWINQREPIGPSLGKELIEDYLLKNPKMDASVRKVLELRLLAGGTAVSKYDAALRFAEDDNRVRDQLLYYGATGTGRWSGKGLQPHNFKREKTLDEIFIDSVKTGDHETVKVIAGIEGKTVFDVLKGCLRGIICASPGKKLIFSDFAGIESRVLNWLCKNETKLDLFRRGQDAYIHTALDVYGTDYDTIANWNGTKWKIKPEHSDKRQIGKACELGLGYGMGWETFQVNAARAGSILDNAFSLKVVNTWRLTNPEIPAFWQRIEKECKSVISRPKRRVTMNGLVIYWDPRGYLCIQLPSGRVLRYFGAQIHKNRSPEAENDYDQIYYLDGGKFGHSANSGRINTYGGKLCENVIQAISRDLLVYSMMIVADANIDLIFHVHDEVVVEVDKGDSESFGIVHRAMETIPPWAEGLPLAAETQESRRFTK